MKGQDRPTHLMTSRNSASTHWRVPPRAAACCTDVIYRAFSQSLAICKLLSAQSAQVQATRSRSRAAAASPEVVEALRQQLKASEAELRRVREQVKYRQGDPPFLPERNCSVWGPACELAH